MMILSVTRLPLTDGLAFVIVMAAPSVVYMPLGLVSDARCDGHHKMVDSEVGAAMANSCQHNGAMTAVRNAREVF